MNIFKQLPNLKNDKNNKFLLKLLELLGLFEDKVNQDNININKSLDNVNHTINSISDKIIKKLGITPLAFTNLNMKNNSYIIENNTNYFIIINIDIYPQAQNVSINSNTPLCKIESNLELTSFQEFQFITYQDAITNVFNVSLTTLQAQGGQIMNNVFVSGDNGLNCQQNKTGKLFGTLIIEKEVWKYVFKKFQR